MQGTEPFKITQNLKRLCHLRDPKHLKRLCP
jgi:hypothetical protein